MHYVTRSVVVHYSAAQMFDLVADVEKYPQFMPWCADAKVHEQNDTGMRASISMSFAGFKQTFTTQNRHHYPHQIDIALVDGVFSHLVGKWRFQTIDEHTCKVEFNLTYSFNNFFLERVIGPVFNRIANNFIDSFRQRAMQVYGPSN